jgi:hypothetical protein
LAGTKGRRKRIAAEIQATGAGTGTGLTGVLEGLDDRAKSLPDELPDDARSLRPLIDDARESLGILLGYFIG